MRRTPQLCSLLAVLALGLAACEPPPPKKLPPGPPPPPVPMSGVIPAFELKVSVTPAAAAYLRRHGLRLQFDRYVSSRTNAWYPDLGDKIMGVTLVPRLELPIGPDGMVRFPRQTYDPAIGKTLEDGKVIIDIQGRVPGGSGELECGMIFRDLETLDAGPHEVGCSLLSERTAPP